MTEHRVVLRGTPTITVTPARDVEQRPWWNATLTPAEEAGPLERYSAEVARRHEQVASVTKHYYMDVARRRQVHKTWKVSHHSQVAAEQDEATLFFREKAGRVDTYLRQKRAAERHEQWPGIHDNAQITVTEDPAVARYLDRVCATSPTRKIMQSIEDALNAIEEAKSALQDAEDQLSAERTESYDEGYSEGHCAGYAEADVDADTAYANFYASGIDEAAVYIARRGMKDMMDRKAFNEELLTEVIATQLEAFLRDPDKYTRELPIDNSPYRYNVPADFELVERSE